MDLEVNLVTIGLPGGSGTSAKKQKTVMKEQQCKKRREELLDKQRQKHHLSAHYNFMGRGNITSVSLSGSQRQEAQFHFSHSHLLNIYLKSGIESCFSFTPTPSSFLSCFLFKVSRVSNITVQNSNSLSCHSERIAVEDEKYGSNSFLAILLRM